MVVLRELQAHDFKHLNVDITFPQGILAISGPNESGKSSIFEAILFAFYGRTDKAPLGQKDRLINYDAEELFVSLTFELEGQLFRVTRRVHRKRPSQAKLVKLSSDGAITPLASGVKNVDEELVTLLNGIALSDFLASNVVLQKDLDRLTQMQKMERRDVINAMMGRDCFTQVVDKLANEIRPLKKSVGPERQALEQLDLRKKSFLEHKEELVAKERILSAFDEQLKSLSQTFAKTEKKYNLLKAYKVAKDTQEELQRELDFRKETKDRLKKQVSSLAKLKSQQKQLKTQEKQLRYLKNDEKTFETIHSTSEQLQKLVDEQQMTAEAIKRLESQRDETAHLANVVSEYNQIKAQRLKAEATQQRFFSPLLYIPSIGLIVAGLVALFINLIIGIVLLLASSPFIGYLLKTYISYSKAGPQIERLRARETELSEQVVQFQAREAQIQEHEFQLQEKENQLLELSKHLHTQLGKLNATIRPEIPVSSESDFTVLQSIVKITTQKIMELQAKQSSIAEQLESIENQLADIQEVEEDVSRNETEISTLQEQLSALMLPQLPTEVKEFSESLYEELDNAIKSIGEEKATLQTNRRNTVERIEALTLLVKENEGVLEEYREKEQEVAQLEENISSGELTIDLIRVVAERGREQVRPRVVKVMERLLAAITDGKYRFPKLSEDYSLKVYSATAGEYVEAKLFSGGTEDQFLLALRLGFAIALLPHGRGTAPKFLLLDEPFGGSDIQRRDNIILLLKEELSRIFQQIIVVSHQSAILSASEFQYRMINGRVIQTE